MSNMSFLVLLSGTMQGESSNWSGTLGFLGQFFYFLIVTVIVLFFAYCFIKLTTKARLSKQGGRNLEIIESIAVSYQNYIQLVRVCDKYILLGINKDKMTFLTEVDAEGIAVKDENGAGFEGLLADQIKKISRRN